MMEYNESIRDNLRWREEKNKHRSVKGHRAVTLVRCKQYVFINIPIFLCFLTSIVKIGKRTHYIILK